MDGPFVTLLPEQRDCFSPRKPVSGLAVTPQRNLRDEAPALFSQAPRQIDHRSRHRNHNVKLGHKRSSLVVVILPVAPLPVVDLDAVFGLRFFYAFLGLLVLQADPLGIEGLE